MHVTMTGDAAARTRRVDMSLAVLRAKRDAAGNALYDESGMPIVDTVEPVGTGTWAPPLGDQTLMELRRWTTLPFSRLAFIAVHLVAVLIFWPLAILTVLADAELSTGGGAAAGCITRFVRRMFKRRKE